MVANVLEINAQRLWESLERSAEIGRFRDVGLRRLALSAEDKQMRDLFVGWAKQAGCSIEIDRLGNIFSECRNTLWPLGRVARETRHDRFFDWQRNAAFAVVHGYGIGPKQLLE